MKSQRKRLGAIVAAVAVVAIFLASLSGARPMASVQAAVVTPVTQTARGSDPARVLNFFSPGAITADTRKCFELSNYEIADLQYNIDQGTVNTVTLTLQQSNDGVTYSSANTIVSANAADANSLLEFPLFGKFNCVLADVTNSNSLSLTVIGVAK